MTLWLLVTTNFGHDTSLQVLPQSYILFLTPGFHAAEIEPWLLLIPFINKLIRGNGLKNKMRILYAFEFAEMHGFLGPGIAVSSQYCHFSFYLITHIPEFSQNAISSLRTRLMPWIFVSNSHRQQYLTYRGFAGLDIHKMIEWSY